MTSISQIGHDGPPRVRDRLPRGTAALLILALSLTLWGALIALDIMI